MIQNGKNCNLEKPVPGCLGRVVNLFDLNTGVGGNRLLMDKPHRDGSPLSRRQSDVSRMSPLGDQMEDKVMVSELRRPSSNRKSNGTPIKMLIAQEMSKEVESKHNPPSLVAKLMGLDALPQQQPNSASRRGHSRGSSRSHSGISMDFLQQEHGFLNARTQHELHHYPEQKEYKDVYEIWQQSGKKTDYVRDISPQKGRYNDTKNEKKMDLVRQKFMEAKRLSTDEKLRQTKQFQDALEVLSSNKDLFLKFLQEPNSMFSQHLYNLQTIRPPPDTKRITVLRPSKMAESNKITGSGKKNEKQIKETAQAAHLSGWEKKSPGFSPPPECYDNPSQPTRIVVLKPSPGKPQDIKTASSPPSSSLRTSNGEEFYGCLENSEALESREVAKEITQQMCENLSGHRRDETLLSSVFSNGYIGDESSFNKSEIEYAGGNLSDSEVMSPTSRHSWDYINRFGSPYSTSSFSRASYSPESSVCREAKKRLSERWAMMASNGTYQEQRHVRRSSSTLGEMLALSDLKKSVRPEEEDSIKEQESRGSTSCLTSNWKKDEVIDDSPKNLLRSKSVPVSSTVSGIRLNVQAADPEKAKADGLKDVARERNVKSTFKGRVSSLFFSRSRKSSKEKSQLSKDVPQSVGVPGHSPGKTGNDASHVNDRDVEEEFSAGLQRSLGKASCQDPLNVGPKQGIILPESGFSVTKPVGPESSNENQDQPSPISVLEPLFEEDDRTASVFSGNFRPDQHAGVELPVNTLKSNLIDKSPPIGSIARTLSWEDSAMETATSYPSKPPVAPLGAELEEQECLFLVQTLLSAAGIDNELHSDSFLARWHSPDSPLDPSLRDKYVNLNDKDILHEAKRRQRRSFRKLVFDCVNAVFVEIAGHGPCSGPQSRIEDCSSSLVLVDRVWARMKEWISGEVRCAVWGVDGGDNSSLVVERVVRKEVVGRGWVEHLRLEIDNIRKEIEEKLLEELVEEAVTELTGRQ